MDSKLVSSDDTICAICTPDGVGSLAVIRISGPRALDITKEIFKPKNTKTSFKPNMTNLGNIYYKEKLIDQGIGIYFKSPNSLTGQDVVELQTHGGYVVPKMVLKALLVAGARLAEPGEFSFRSFLNGKIDLLEA
ncbi:MAG: tRNA uridine-5-carboxymethylaminomethyl(34) synthesis GTPase MnmE, partial [Thermodesulfobacteriota bacteirum]|nr:tRNA uridine-5-carboxymethylaminomethyl(34) synthesis GTPase MnmE [Thermodesulfobacteriota bacterium]